MCDQGKVEKSSYFSKVGTLYWVYAEKGGKKLRG